MLRKEWRMEMKIPASAVRPLVVLAVAAASVGCIVPAYAEDATATVTSDDSNHIIVDINLHDDADSSVSGSKATSSSTDEHDSKTTGEAKDTKEDELKGKWLAEIWEDMPMSLFLIVVGFAVIAAIIGGIFGAFAGDMGVSFIFCFGFFTIALILGTLIYFHCFLT